MAQDHATIGMEAGLRFELVEIAIEPLDQGARETDVDHGRVFAFGAPNATWHRNVPLCVVLWGTCQLRVAGKFVRKYTLSPNAFQDNALQRHHAKFSTTCWGTP